VVDASGNIHLFGLGSLVNKRVGTQVASDGPDSASDETVASCSGGEVLLAGGCEIFLGSVKTSYPTGGGPTSAPTGWSCACLAGESVACGVNPYAICVETN
jgi:hypothetical protein